MIWQKSHTRFTYATIATLLTFSHLHWGNPSPGGEVAAYGFLIVVAGMFGVTKAIEHHKNGQ